MAIQLKNKDLCLRIETAGEKYTGTRFDWNGTVVQVEYRGKPMLSQEKLPFHRNPHVDGRGLHNEFGIKNCIGYDDVPVGGWFPKIGTGWLRRDEKPYSFLTTYEREPLAYSASVPDAHTAVFTCVSGERNGYSYTYEKTVALSGASFTIRYRLDNTGAKKIETSEYIHNFLKPCGSDIGTQLTLSFPWEFSPDRLAENVNTAGQISFDRSGCTFLGRPSGVFFLGGVWGARTDPLSDRYRAMNGKWTVCDVEHAVSISETDSFIPWNCDVWGHRGVLSPELFTWLSCEPGASCEWSRTYRFEQIGR